MPVRTSSSACKLVALAFGALSMGGASTAFAHGQIDVPVTALPGVNIEGNYDNAVGSSDASSQGQATSKLIESRPTLRPADVLEFVPGVIVTQHSGGGKANQYFLRGFNLDHGTDFATFVDGMPVNMPSHAHGQGYSDINWLIPELIDRIRYKKGPYFADEGDLSSAGAARIDLLDFTPLGIASLTVGQRGYRRGLVTDSNIVGDGKLLYAIEAAHNDGPWNSPEKFHRTSGLLRYSFGNAADRSSITAMGYDAGWMASDQIPLNAVANGQLARFATVDPTDGGVTSRYSLSFNTSSKFDDGSFQLSAYAIQSKLDLFSNFTYYLNDPVHGDQFEQAEHRRVIGLSTRRSWDHSLVGQDSMTSIGLQIRRDRLSPVGLYTTEQRQRLDVTQESQVRQTNAALYAENATQWLSWLRSVAGLRTDHFDFDVTSSIAANSGRRNADITSPKVSFIFGPWAQTEYFINYGHGYHSNDARGITESVSPREGTPASPAPPLVRSKGAEIGARSEWVPGLQTSLALWQLKLGSELVFAGDAGDIEPSRASKRSGLEWGNHYVASRWLLIDADLSWSRARFTQDDPAGDRIPGSIAKVASVGATVPGIGPWSGHLQLRYFGPRPLIEDGSQRSSSTTLASLRVGYKLSSDLRLAFDVFNLFNRKASDIDYFYASRLERNQPASDSIHLHPVEPRSARVTLTASF